MRKRLVVVGALICVVALVAGVILVSGAGAASSTRVARMTGAQETDPGDTNGTGRAVIRLDPSRGRVCFDLQWRRIEAPTLAHIHPGRRGVANPPVVTLFESMTPLPESIKGVRGCTGGHPRALLRDIRANPRDYYVNVHNEDFPNGAIRGQLRRP
jgi:hypothetical protein